MTGTKTQKHTATHSTKLTNKHTKPTATEATEQPTEEDGTERTDTTSYLTSSDEDSVAETPGEESNTMPITTRRGIKKRRKDDGDDEATTELDTENAKRIAELEKQLASYTKKKRLQRLPKSMRPEDSSDLDANEQASTEVLVVRRYSPEEAKAARNKEIMKCVRNATKSCIWRVAKFVKSEKHLDLLTEYVMNYLQVPGTMYGKLQEGTKKWNEVLVERQNFVSTYRDLVRKEINDKRSYTMVSFWMQILLLLK